MRIWYYIHKKRNSVWIDPPGEQRIVFDDTEMCCCLGFCCGKHHHSYLISLFNVLYSVFHIFVGEDYFYSV